MTTTDRLYSWEHFRALRWANVPMTDEINRCAFDDSGIWPTSASEPQPLLIDLTKEMEEKP